MCIRTKVPKQDWFLPQHGNIIYRYNGNFCNELTGQQHTQVVNGNNLTITFNGNRIERLNFTMVSLQESPIFMYCKCWTHQSCDLCSEVKNIIMSLAKTYTDHLFCLDLNKACCDRMILVISGLSCGES